MPAPVRAGAAVAGAVNRLPAASLAPTMADAIKDEASDDPAVAKRVSESATRVVAMKERRGLAHC